MLRSGRRGAAEGNTTIGVVATNARLTKEQTNRLASVAHDGIARAIRPAHTQADGDTLFAMATGEKEVRAERQLALEAFAALVVERAILKGILAAKSLAGIPSAQEWRAGK
jgi:L-aminopeptidase/D-esterase-like protein